MAQVFGPNELLEDVFQKGLCIGCGACVDLCPYFKSYKGKTAMLFPCTLIQGRCYAFCPKTEVDLDDLSSTTFGKPYEGTALGLYRDVVISQAGKDKDMDAGVHQSGGTVSSLMTFALKTGLIDAAVLTDRAGLIPVPRLVTRPEEVTRCASSKYMAAPTLAALNQGVRQGYTQMGVVGTPCQLTAVAQMRSNPLGEENFVDPVALTVGLFCTWALDTRDLIAFLSERLPVSQIRKMDIPPPPAEILVLETEVGKIEVPLDDIRALVPTACHVCPDMTSEWADLSVGVLEGKPDWNTLIIRTEKGSQLVDAARDDGYLVVDKIPEGNLTHLRSAAENKKKRSLTQAREKGILNNTKEGTRPSLRLRNEVVQRIIA